jgi:hypothetical protein
MYLIYVEILEAVQYPCNRAMQSRAPDENACIKFVFVILSDNNFDCSFSNTSKGGPSCVFYSINRYGYQ